MIRRAGRLYRCMTEDAELLAHYVERGGEPWNVSLEASWLDYELRAWVKPRLPEQLAAGARATSASASACGMTGSATSWASRSRASTRDPGYLPAVPAAPGARAPSAPGDRALLRREHGRPRLSPRSTSSRSSARRSREAFDRAARSKGARSTALAPGGVLLIADVGNREPPADADEVRRLGEIWIAFRGALRQKFHPGGGRPYHRAMRRACLVALVGVQRRQCARAGDARTAAPAATGRSAPRPRGRRWRRR